MEVDNNDDVKEDTTLLNTSSTSPSPTPTAQPPLDPYTAALLKMESRLTRTMKEMLEPLKTDINSLVLSQREGGQQKTDVKNLHIEKERLNSKIKEVEEKNCKLEDRVKKLEDKLMESNLILHGIKESSWELDSTRNELVVNAIASTVHAENDSSKLEIARKIPITSTSCLGRYNPLRSRPIRVSFASKSDAELLLERKKKLQKGIYVDREYSDKDEVERKLLKPILLAARKHSHYRGKCKLEGTKLVIKGKTYSWKNLDQLPEDISTSTISSKVSSTTVGFFGELNPLSNFFPSEFSYNGNKYHSSEQLIQHQKALLFGDKVSANHIMHCTTALGCKNLARDISNYNHECWKNEVHARCEEGIKAKFMQDIGVRSYLLNTGDKKLVECCNNKFWGNGVRLHQENCLDPNTWSSQGLLGEILQNIRHSIHDILGSNNSGSVSV